MSTKKSNKKLPPTTANDPTPHLDLPNKEKGIETIYLKDEQK
jgi:hypothetical protein